MDPMINMWELENQTMLPNCTIQKASYSVRYTWEGLVLPNALKSRLSPPRQAASSSNNFRNPQTSHKNPHLNRIVGPTTDLVIFDLQLLNEIKNVIF